MDAEEELFHINATQTEEQKTGLVGLGTRLCTIHQLFNNAVSCMCIVDVAIASR